MSWTTPADVIDAWIGDDVPADPAKLQLWIDQAERLIRFYVPGIQARIDEPEADLLDNVISVVVAMVSRKFRNPEGIRQASITTGPFSEQRTYGGDEPGSLLILPDELALISGDTQGGQRAFVVDTLPTSSRYSPFYSGTDPLYYSEWCP